MVTRRKLLVGVAALPLAVAYARPGRRPKPKPSPPAPATTKTVTGLAPATTYRFTVAAKDSAGRLGAQSAPILVTTGR
jgi:hypothetical protein